MTIPPTLSKSSLYLNSPRDLVPSPEFGLYDLWTSSSPSSGPLNKASCSCLQHQLSYWLCKFDRETNLGPDEELWAELRPQCRFGQPDQFQVTISSIATWKSKQKVPYHWLTFQALQLSWPTSQISSFLTFITLWALLSFCGLEEASDTPDIQVEE